jgi:ubiquinone biosynthesis protein
VIEAELGDRSRHLVDIDHTPIAAGSISQVHSAHLADGTEVVVKVQRPQLTRILCEDLSLLRAGARWAIRLCPSLVAANPGALVEDFANGLAQQLSFRTEIANMERMRVVLARWPVRIPRVYRSLSSERVLVMERLEGVGINHVEAIDALGVERSNVVSTVAGSFVASALGQGIFHGDLHAGNMLVLPHGEVGLLDFGVMGRLDGRVRSAVSDLLGAVVGRRFDGVAAAMLQLADTRAVNWAEIVPEMQAMIGSYLDRPLGELDVAAALGRMLAIAASHGLVLPESAVAFFKQLLYLDGVCRSLQPDFDLLEGGATILTDARCQPPQTCLNVHCTPRAQLPFKM